MKKILFISSVAALSVAASSYAQQLQLIAGIDFTTFQPNDASAASNFSDIGGSGTFTVIDSPTILSDFADSIDSSDTDLSVGTTINSDDRVTGLNDQFGEGGSVFFQNSPFLTNATGGGFEFTVNAAGSAFTDIEIVFGAGIVTSGVATLDLEYSIGGGASNDLGSILIDQSLLSTEGQLISLAPISEVATEITFTGIFSSIDAGTGLSVDNLQISGVVVPEPSSYAAIFGALVLGFVACRRRK